MALLVGERDQPLLALVDREPEHVGSRVVTYDVKVELRPHHFGQIDVSVQDTFFIPMRARDDLTQRGYDDATARTHDFGLVGK
jgi:hypothetical protein